MSTTELPLPSINVLVVDDRPEGRIALRHVLSTRGYRIVEAGSADEALKVLLREEFAVILLDVRMPKIDGFELARIIRDRDRTRAVPIIFITGEADEADQASRGYAMGAVDYLVKPVRPEVVRAKVAIFANLHRQKEQLRTQASLVREIERNEQERRLAELRLASERRFRAVTDAMPQIVWTARADGAVDYFNRRWFEYSGLSRADAVSGFRAALHPDDLGRCRGAWEAARVGGEPYQEECRLRGGDGAYRWHLGRAVPERDQVGAIVGWIGTLTDIDDLKRAESAVQEAVHVRDEFISIASHELRTPLASLALQVQSLARASRAEALSQARATAQLEIVERQVSRMTRLVDELLDVSRVAAGRLRLELEEVDLSGVVREVVERLDHDARRASCAIRIRADQPIVGRWDRLRLEQVVMNLLTNALKFGRGKPIAIAAERTDHAACLRVEDHGIGIRPEDQARIFARFETAVSTHQYGGLGLGLYITREIVEAHGGAIRVESRPGEGATFVVDLPLAT